MRVKRVNLPEFIQMEGAECGAASLKIILEYYGSKISINTSKKAIGIGRDGSSGVDILKAGKKFGLSFSPKIVTVDEIKNKLQPPYILFWDNCHWLVVEGFEDGYIYVSDPAQGNVRYREQDLERYLSGLALIPKKFDKSKIVDEGLTPNKNIFDFIYSYKNSILFSILLGFISIVPEIAFALIIGVFTEQVANNNFGTGIFRQSLLLFLIIGIFTSLLFLRFKLLNLISNNMILRLSKIQISKLISAPILFFAVRSIGELGSRIANTTGIARLITSELIPGIYTYIRTLIILIILFTVEWRLALLITIVFSISTCLIFKFYKESQRDNAITNIYENETFGILFDIVNSSELVKSTGAEISYFQNWSAQFALLIESSQGVYVANANISTIIQISTYLITTGVLFSSACLIMTGEIDLAIYTAFLYLAGIVTDSLSGLPSTVSAFNELLGSKYRLNDTLDLEEDKYSYLGRTQNKNIISSSKDDSFLDEFKYNKNSFYIEDLTFYYPGSKVPNFTKINHEFKEGSFTSIIGPSGCGKSTLAKILCNLIPYKEGKIIINSKEFKTLPIDISRSLISYVPQDAFVFGGNLYDNITLFDNNISNAVLSEAIEITDLANVLNIHKDIRYFKIEDNGSNLSAGQKQIIEIARALVRKPKLLILDEATSAIDINLEKLILRRIKETNITIISIAFSHCSRVL